MKENLCRLVTETPNPRTGNLDRIPTLAMLKLINREDLQVPRAVALILPALAEFVDEAARRMARGGRIFYVGAGTSGRLGVLDASECPPTFGIKPDRFQGIIAGGLPALVRAVEGAEDDVKAGAAALKRKKLLPGDCVVGISASGRTPFVLGALKYARRLRAMTAGITCNPRSPIVTSCRYPLVAEVGPEVITGSTRMKCGTAEKLILNMISTGVMVRCGKVEGNRMVDLVPGSWKLRERARGLVMNALGVNAKQADALLKRAGGNPRNAIRFGERGTE